MKFALSENLKKKIKKNIYGKPQSISIVFPTGFGEVALREIKLILQNLWFAKNLASEFSLSTTEIRIDHIYMFAVIELLMRAQCISDIRLIIFQGRASGKSEFEKKCRAIDWDFYLNKNMSLKIKIDSTASHAFHETGLKEILHDIIKNNVSDIYVGENTQQTTTLYAYLFKNKLTVSLSLAGVPLYKRGYRSILSASAPLREDAASCCIEKALTFAKKIHANYLPQTVLIPFSGTGTFAFEFLQLYFKFYPSLFTREYALQKMNLFRSENFLFLLKKVREHCNFMSSQNPLSTVRICCIDSSNNANASFSENMETFKHTVEKNGFVLPSELFYQTINHTPYFNEDFLNIDIYKTLGENSQIGNLFIPLNPPYGQRLNRHSDTVDLYKKIASKLNEIALFTSKEHHHVLGFILCPSEETWLSFSKQLNNAQMETYHFTQGGLDVRVCQFFI